ncbi:universal stress protein [Alicyclobacillus sp. SO9]|uniref:universal stress protein n=1 Tax=Alicyclobacillus sp. SO9 TaxID=2665646 RepID=UPI0018E88933|nr:universal stress protein [Alicyclobacillus sp. SO9]QQE78962.1 universal stress protein [Alicyclobacillus sp. SO9]
MKKILFAADGSDSALHAAKLANEFLEVWPDATVDVFYVTQMFTSAHGVNVSAEFAKDLAKEVKEHSMAPSEKNQHRVRFRHERSVTSPAIVLAQVAKDEGFDLIVCGSHGRNAVNRFFLGSVSHGLVHHAEVPVLVARERTED